jgi:glyoxylase-like metal-dependent hydrolase (beta-lactamase superfamily II)
MQHRQASSLLRLTTTILGRIALQAVTILVVCALSTQIASAQQPPREVTVTTTLLGGSVYGIDGKGGRMAALVGPEGAFLVDARFPAVSDKIVAALKQLSPTPLRLLVNTHVHGDHTGGNENFAKLGVTILGRPALRAQQLNPRPGPGNGQVPPVAPPMALPIVLFDAATTVYLNGETVQLIPLAPAHTDGDTAVKFVQADVLMTGDVFRSEGFPAAAITNGGSILGILDAMEVFLELSGPATKVVPGHGPVTNRAALVAHRDLIVTVRDRVSQAIREGKTLEQIRDSKPTADFDASVGGNPAFIVGFIDALFNELSAAR